MTYELITRKYPIGTRVKLLSNDILASFFGQKKGIKGTVVDYYDTESCIKANNILRYHKEYGTEHPNVIDWNRLSVKLDNDEFVIINIYEDKFSIIYHE